jgi:hypothetical protein
MTSEDYDLITLFFSRHLCKCISTCFALMTQIDQ